MQSPRAQFAREYVAKRGLTQETVTGFELGYAPNEWDALLRYLTGKGYGVDELMEAGLLVERDDGGHYDRFRNRLVIPIRERRGQVVGFGARALDDSLPKYLNSPQTLLFDKGNVLFGLDRAARGIRTHGEVVIVEGYMDALAAHQVGADNVVASMGTALTETHLNQLSRLTERIILALDPDAAGDQATLRGLALARQTLGRRKVPTLSARGTVEHEERLLVDLRILSLPEGKDPDEVLRDGIQAWQALVQQAQPLVEYWMNQALREIDLDDPRSKSRAVQEMKPVLLELADAIERQEYTQRLARRLRLDEAVVEREVLGDRPARRPSKLAGGGQRRRKGPAVAEELADTLTPTPPVAGDFGMEEQCLQYLARTPGLIHMLSLACAEAGVPFLETEDFTRPENRAIYAQIKRNAEAGDLAEASRLQEMLGQPLAAYVDALLNTPAPDIPADEQSEDLTRCAFRVKSRSLRQTVDRLYYLLQEPEQDDSRAYSQLIQAALAALQQIDRSLHARSMVGRRASLEPKSRS
jgi:DNA primase